MKVEVFNEDCLSGMNAIPDKSIDLILCDPPYGTTVCSWDCKISLPELWQQWLRVIKPNSPIVVFSTQPFTSVLVSSNIKMFKYEWVWEKSRPGGFVNARIRPLKAHESICVFTDGPIANKAYPPSPYNPQGLIKVDKQWRRPKRYSGLDRGVTPTRESHLLQRVIEFENYPKSVIRFSNPNRKLSHPTEKPVDLLSYLIKTYSNKGDTVLDSCMGGGSCGVAAVATGRGFIGFEIEEKYFKIARERIFNTLGE